jgi:hypothetical protein
MAQESRCFFGSGTLRLTSLREVSLRRKIIDRLIRGQ